jgi:hypothetical protein
MQLNFFEEHGDLVTDSEGKICAKCDTYLPFSSYTNASGGNYLRSECKKCAGKLSIARKKLKEITPLPMSGHNCPICDKGIDKVLRSGPATSNTPWVLDHCHDTGTFRGWLCHKCNRALGGLDDDIDTLKRAIKYLETHLKQVFLV